MKCRKCGYVNDFLTSCPFHESPLDKRVEEIRKRKAELAKAEARRRLGILMQVERESMEDAWIVGDGGYLAWLRWDGHTYQTCDSDDEGAFKVYRHADGQEHD